MRSFNKWINEIFFATLALVFLSACGPSKQTSADNLTDTLFVNKKANGYELEISFKKGPEHNYPLMAVWIEDTAGNYLQTLYVAESIAKGVFQHGQTGEGKWMPGPIRRPAALPYWSHSRGVREEDGLYVPMQKTAIADAYSGATPVNNFVLNATTDNHGLLIFDLYFEINQSWDWNEFWTNNKYPDDKEYKSSCQPALVYHACIDMQDDRDEYELKVIGHSHYSGKNGELYSDLSTITTALQIAENISVKIR